MARSFTGNFVINADMSQMRAMLNDKAFANQLNIELKSENVTETNVWYRFHHGASFSSWGEKITITLTPDADGKIKLDIFSECALPTQIMDAGKNKKNVNAIVKVINESIANYPVISSLKEEVKETIAVSEEPFKEQPTTAPIEEAVTDDAPKQSLTDRAIFCGKCGRRFEEEANFCAKCGNKR